MKIVSPNEHDDFMVVGWKVAKKLPSWVCNANSWSDFMNGNYEEDDGKKKKIVFVCKLNTFNDLMD